MMIDHRGRRSLIAGMVVLLMMVQGCTAQSVERPLNRPTGTDLLNARRSLQALVGPRAADKRRISLLVEKSKYRLTVYDNGTAIKSYPVVLGRNPVDDKVREGDQCTPEGHFQIQDRYPHPSWHRFLWINYPTEDSWTKHRKAKADGTIDAGASIGGEIGIHGVPEGQDRLVDQRINWTLGCISLKNTDVEEIYEVVERGTPVDIVH